MKNVFRLKDWFGSLRTWQKIVGIALLVGIVVIIRNNFGSSKNEMFSEYSVKRGDISETITNSGNVSTSGNTPIYSSTTGIVEEVFVRNGDPVTEGQELIKIKSTATELEKSNVLASYQSALSGLYLAKQTKISNQSLLEAGRKSVIDAGVALDQLNDRRNNGTNNPATNKQYTQNEIESIKSSDTSAKKSFEALENKFRDSDSAIAAAQSLTTSRWLAYQATQNGLIKAPIAGIIINLMVEPGDMVNASTLPELPTSSSQPVVRISTNEKISIGVKLSEIDIAKVRSGQNASLVFDAVQDKEFSAIVSRVDTVGVNNNSVVTYDVYVTMKDSDERIRPGMTVTVTIQTDDKKGVLIVPNIGLKKENGRTIVQVQKGKKLDNKVVTIGIKNSTQSEVISGLIEGENIIIPKSK